MPNPLSGFDLKAPDIMDTLLVRINELNDARIAAQWALRATGLTDEQLQLLNTLMDVSNERDFLTGARLALKKKGVMGGGQAEQLKAERMARHEAMQRAASAEAKLAKAEARLARAEPSVTTGKKPRPTDRYVPDPARPVMAALSAVGYLASDCTPTAPPPPPKPDWDYKPVEKRTQQRGEVITSDSFGVEVVARQVEAFVTRHGKCLKPDVSAALSPDLRPLLAAAYRHLHASRRVHVSGWELSLWPHSEAMTC